MKTSYNAGKNSPKFRDLSGLMFGKLKPLEYTSCTTKYGTVKYMWKCTCTCGKCCYIRTNELTSGTRTQCKSCSITDQKNRQILPNNGSVINRAFRMYKRNANQRSLDFKLTLNDFCNLIDKDCSYCGTSPKINKGEKIYAQSEFKRNGIDRVNPSAGYTLDNVVPCCSTCNTAKLTLSTEEFLAWIKRVYEHQKLR